MDTDIAATLLKHHAVTLYHDTVITAIMLRMLKTLVLTLLINTLQYLHNFY